MGNRKNKIPWTEIRLAYETGWDRDGHHVFPSLVDLSEVFNVTYAQLLTHKKHELWEERRQRNYREISEIGSREAVQRLGHRLGELNALALEAAIDDLKTGKSLAQLVKATAMQHVDKETSQPKPVPHKDLKALLGSYKDNVQGKRTALDAGRLASGASTENVQLKHELTKTEPETAKAMLREAAEFIDIIPEESHGKDSDEGQGGGKADGG